MAMHNNDHLDREEDGILLDNMATKRISTKKRLAITPYRLCPLPIPSQDVDEF